MNAPFLSPIPPIFSRSSVSSVSSSTSKRRGLLRASAPVLLALVLGVGLAGCDDTASTSSDAPSSTAPAESQQDSGSDGSADSGEAPAEEPAAEPTDDSSGWSGWFGGGDSGSGEGSEEEATPEPEPQKEFYANCDDAKAAGAAPMYKGDPGYRPELDRDKDGIACDQNK
mgnify:FL=1